LDGRPRVLLVGDIVDTGHSITYGAAQWRRLGVGEPVHCSASRSGVKSKSRSTSSAS
jgi:hypothetical protein